MVLVDSAVWIGLLRAQETGPVALLRKLLEAGEAAVTPVIIQEILQGATSPESLEKLRRHFLALPILEPRRGAETYVSAAALYARCRWQGLTPRSPHDCLIVQLAVEHNVPLLHDDRDFETLARVEPGLQLLPRTC